MIKVFIRSEVCIGAKRTKEIVAISDCRYVGADGLYTKKVSVWDMPEDVIKDMSYEISYSKRVASSNKEDKKYICHVNLYKVIDERKGTTSKTLEGYGDIAKLLIRGNIVLTQNEHAYHTNGGRPLTKMDKVWLRVHGIKCVRTNIGGNPCYRITMM